VLNPVVGPSLTKRHSCVGVSVFYTGYNNTAIGMCHEFYWFNYRISNRSCDYYL